MRKDYLTYCKDHAVTHLRDMRGWDESVYGCDLANRLTESINVDGSATYSAYEARQYLKEWWDEAAEVYRTLHQLAYSNPEALHEAPVHTSVRRLDEVGAARKPVLKYTFGE